MEPPLPRETGVACPNCQRPVGTIDGFTECMLMLHCPACDHRWTVSERGAPRPQAATDGGTEIL